MGGFWPDPLAVCLGFVHIPGMDVDRIRGRARGRRGAGRLGLPWGLVGLLALVGPVRHALADANCEAWTASSGVDCQLWLARDCLEQCRPPAMLDNCVQQNLSECAPICTTQATPACVENCRPSCVGDCAQGKFECRESCSNTCNSRCEANCDESSDPRRCRAICAATCDTSCDGACMADAASCDVACEGSCRAACEGEIRALCQRGCQAQRWSRCSAEMTRACQIDCNDSGAIFCEGAYVGGGRELAECIDQVEQAGGQFHERAPIDREHQRAPQTAFALDTSVDEDAKGCALAGGPSGRGASSWLWLGVLGAAGPGLRRSRAWGRN